MTLKVVYYANCQFRGLNFFLQKCLSMESFHIENYSLIKEKKKIPYSLLRNADIFIYQPIDKRHGLYSTDKSIKNNIMSHLQSKCITISFPYIYNSSLWILIPQPSSGTGVDKYIGDFSNFKSNPIGKLKYAGYSLDEVLEMYTKGDIDFDYEKKSNETFEILRQKEKNCDVKVADYIRNNIQKHKLFFTQNHPTTRVFIHCVNQILSILSIDTKYDEETYPEQWPWKVPGLGSKLEYPHTSYDVKYWNFQYDIKNVNDDWYIKFIKQLYNSL